MVSTKEIAKQIRTDLKSLSGFKFSIQIKTFSGGSSISVDVMTAPHKMIRTMAEIPINCHPERDGRYKREDIEKMQSAKYHQLNQYQNRSMDEYNPDTWNNGVFLTEFGHNTLKKIVEIVEKYHRDSSDSSIDYFNCNFYFHLGLGKWDVPFIDGIATAPMVPAPSILPAEEAVNTITISFK